MTFSRILGTGSYLPPNILTNADWEKRVDTTDKWIFERTGIRSRHIATSETASEMGALAAREALQAAGVATNEIDLIIVSTGTPDKIFPSTACLIQKELNIPICPALDIQAACSGFIYALSIADKFIKTGAAKKALVVGTELMSRLMDWTDRKTCVLFGDGSGAVVLGEDDTTGVLFTKLYADGKYADILSVDNTQCASRSKALCADTITADISPYLHMEGQRVFKLAVNTFDSMVQDIQNELHLELQDIDWLIPHQANTRIIQAAADKLGLPKEKVVMTVETQGNTSSASIPLALDHAVRSGDVQRGQLLLMEAFGGGLTWGSALLRF
ncbi:MAG: beta-ketoacyl-ACP synthase III [Gammaproteobacteria bacterium]